MEDQETAFSLRVLLTILERVIHFDSECTTGGLSLQGVELALLDENVALLIVYRDRLEQIRSLHRMKTYSCLCW